MIRKRKNREKNAIHRHCFFNEDESSEDNLIMWLQGRELVKKHGRFISRNGSGGDGGVDPGDGSYDWVKDL